MLRLPRRSTRKRRSNQTHTRNARIPPIAEPGTTLRLNVNLKITWLHFETLRLKFARIVTAKRKLSRRDLFKQPKAQTRHPRTVPLKYKPRTLIWYSGFPHLPYYAKGRGSRMGKGKSATKHWCFKGRANHPLVHFKHTNRHAANTFAYKAAQLIPCYTTHNIRARAPLSEWDIDEINSTATVLPSAVFPPYRPYC